MTIDDIEVKVKKYDREKGVVFANVTIGSVFEIRGYTVRYGTTKYSDGRPVWIASPPSTKAKNKKEYYWIARVLDTALWEQIKKKLIDAAKEHTNLL